MLRIGVQQGLKKLVQGFAKPLAVNVVIKKPNLLPVNAQFIRNTSFFNRLTQEQLWKGVTSVSNAGKKRGRGRGGDSRGKRNLNEGQRIGRGKINMLWPGLTHPVLEEDGFRQIKQLPETDKPQMTVVPTYKKMSKSHKVHPLERGWSGKTAKGKRVGPPESVQDETFEGFESIILDHKLKAKMTAVLGRKRKFFTIVATGNGNGLVGVGTAKVPEAASAIRLAKHRASRRLLTIDLINKNIINHDFFTEYGRTRITVFKRPEGYGLRCHRIIIALCQLIGIENLHAKIEGPITPKHIIRAFLAGLLKQKTYQEIADEKQLHLVEYTKETLDFPCLLASPKVCLPLAEARKNPILFQEYIMGGKLIYEKEARKPFYMKLPSWSAYLKKTLFHRNHDKVKIQLLAKYGGYMSHLTRIYPECRNKSPAEVETSQSH